jgi:outer membrane protein TolC
MKKFCLAALTLCAMANLAWADTNSTTPSLLPLPNFSQAQAAAAPNPPLLYNSPTQQTDLNLLTPQSALVLALNRNPDINIAINNRKVQRYDLLTAEQAFEPQFSVTGTTSYAKNNYGSGNIYNTSTANIGPAVTWTFPLGTQLAANWGYGPTHQSGTGAMQSTSNSWTITLTQPLLQNFGTDVNEVPLENARDDQGVDDLQLQDTIVNTVSSVMDDYYAVVQAEQSLQIAKESLVQSEATLKNREALLKAGRIPRLDVTQAEIDISTQQQSESQAEQTLNSAKAKILEDLGLPSDTNFEVVKDLTVKKINPDLNASLALAQKNNIDIQIARIQYKEQQRNMLTSENQNRWTLNLQLQRSHSLTDTTYPNTQVTPNTSNLVDNTQASLNLSVPLDDVTLDKNTLAAAVALQNQDISLRNQELALKTNVVAAIQNLQAQWTQLQVSERNLSLSRTNYNAAVIKFKFGQIDAFSLSQQQQQLIQAEINVVNAKITYLQQVRNYEKLIGTLLDTWHIQFEAPTHA